MSDVRRGILFNTQDLGGGGGAFLFESIETWELGLWCRGFGVVVRWMGWDVEFEVDARRSLLGSNSGEAAASEVVPGVDLMRQSTSTSAVINSVLQFQLRTVHFNFPCYQCLV